MRNISPAAMAMLQQRTGGEPVIVVGIRWGFFGELQLYSDVAAPGLLGKVIEVADLESVVDVTNGSNTASLKVTLDDIDGQLKLIFDGIDIHESQVYVFQWFRNLSLSDSFLLFEGRISSPIEWSEGERKLSFDVLSIINDQEVGFSVEEGDFINVPEQLIGQAWPMPFGAVRHSQSLPLDQIPTGTILDDVGIPSSNLKNHIGYIEAKNSEQMAKAACYSRVGAHLKFMGKDIGSRDVYEQGQAYERQAANIYRGLQHEMFSDLARIRRVYSKEQEFDTTSFHVLNGEFFHQDEEIELDVNGASFIGTMHKDVFTVSSRKAPDDTEHREPKTERSKKIASDVVIEDTQAEHDKQIANFYFSQPVGSDNFDVRGKPSGRGGDPCSPPNFIFVNNFAAYPPSNSTDIERKFFFAPKGTQVKPKGKYNLRHIVSIIPNTTVNAVYGKVSVGGIKQLSAVPQEYYHIAVYTFGTIIATMVVLNQPLSSVSGQDWEDELWVDMTSPIGPNVVDVLIYFIQTYTNKQIDPVSFSQARVYEQAYPVSFVLRERKNVVDILKDIAYQARLAIWMRNDVFYIKYLSASYLPVATLTENDIEVKSMIVTTTATEDLVTKYVATYHYDLAKEPAYVIGRYNIPKYGVKEENRTFYIYTSADLVSKSVTFWLTRLANTWKILKVKAFITMAQLETMDSVLVSFQRPYVAYTDVVGVVQRATFNSADYSINLEIWLPVLLGQMITSPFAYLGNASTQVVFPPSPLEGGTFGATTNNEAAHGDLSLEAQNVTFYSPSTGKQGKVASDNADTIPPALVLAPIYTGPTSTVTPKADAKPKTYTDQPPINNLVDKTMPGKITEIIGPVAGISDGKTVEYKAIVYPYGVTEDGEECRVIQTIQDENDIIPTGSWAMVSRMIWYKDKLPVVRFYMQVPVWLPLKVTTVI